MARATSFVGAKRSSSQSDLASLKSKRIQKSPGRSYASNSSSPSAVDGLTETNASPSTTPTDHSCQSCGKILGCNKSLQRHLRVHSTDLPFECMVCHKKFKRHDHLLRHERDIHEKEGHETCLGCGHVCRKDYLPQHLRADKAASCRKAYEDTYSSIKRAIRTEERAALFDSEELEVSKSSGDDLEWEDIKGPATVVWDSSNSIFREHGEIATQRFQDTSKPWTPMDLNQGIRREDIGEYWDPSFERQGTTVLLNETNGHSAYDAQRKQASQHTYMPMRDTIVSTLPQSQDHALINSVRRAAEDLGLDDLSPLSRLDPQERPRRLLNQPKCPKLTCKICGNLAGTSKNDILRHARSCLRTARPCHKCSLCEVMFIFKKDLHNHLKPGVGECVNLSDIDHDYEFDQARLRDRELFVTDLRWWETIQLDLFRSAVKSAVCTNRERVSDRRPATIVFGRENTCISEAPSSAQAKTELQPVRDFMVTPLKDRETKTKEVKICKVENREVDDDFTYFSSLPEQSVLAWTYDGEKDGVW